MLSLNLSPSFRILSAFLAFVFMSFSAIPSEIWKDNFGDAMLQYFEGKLDWDAVEKTAIDGWATEKALAK